MNTKQGIVIRKDLNMRKGKMCDSCHCHPEFWWEEFGTLDEFYQWFETTDWNKTQKHYPV